MKSHLLQMRGLKHPDRSRRKKGYRVASFTDAWIETTLTTALTRPKPSHLLQMRGLKLKDEHGTPLMHYVASFTDAWIETSLNC